MPLFSLRSKEICMYKIVHSLLDFPCDAVFAAPTRIGLRGHTLKIHQQQCKTRRCQHALSVQVVPYWNKLPEDIVTATSVETFKFRLDAQWQSLFPEGPSRNVIGRGGSFKCKNLVPSLNFHIKM